MAPACGQIQKSIDRRSHVRTYESSRNHKRNHPGLGTPITNSTLLRTDRATVMGRVSSSRDIAIHNEFY